MLIRNKIEFTIEIDNHVFIHKPFNETQNGRIQLTLCLNNKNSFKLTRGTKISIPLADFNENEIEIEKDAEDTENIIAFIQEYAPKKDLTKQIGEIFMNFQKKRKKIEFKKNNFTSQYFFDPKKNNNIYSRAWSIIYGLTPSSSTYKILLGNYFIKETSFFQFIEKKYNSLENLNQIEEFTQYFKKRYFYYNSNSFLWFYLTKKSISGII